jgi:formiminotetrahydrofolate cyclodeaminase
LPKGSRDERTVRRAKIQEAQERAIREPEEILGLAKDALTVLGAWVASCNPNLIGDAAVAAGLFEAAAGGALVQVIGNLAGLPESPANALRRKAAQAHGLQARQEAMRIQSLVMARLVAKGAQEAASSQGLVPVRPPPHPPAADSAETA